jgi:geranylgeranyl reductase family protein
MQRTHDIIVVGGGPAGASCARRAAELGLSVVVLEKGARLGAKPCAAGLTERAMALLDGCEEPVVHRLLHVADVALGRDLVFTLTGVAPFVATTTRRELDALLVRNAEKAGALVMLGCGVEAVSQGAGTVTAASGTGEWCARFAVFADGIHGVGRRLIGVAPQRLASAAYVRAFPDTPGDMAHLADRVSFDLSAADRGYGWVFPKNDHLNAGVFTQRPMSKRLLAALGTFLASAGLSQWRTEGPFAFPIPMISESETPGKLRCLLAGDAAGLADPVTGEGISMAVASGRAAAESIASSFDSGEEALAVYGRRIAEEIVPMAVGMRRKGALVYGLGPGLLRALGRVPLLRAFACRVVRSSPAVREGAITIEVNVHRGPFAHARGG